MVETILAALVPVFLTILGGWALRGAGLVDPAFWPAAERLTYYLFFPALLIGSLMRAGGMTATEALPAALGLAAAIAVSTGAAFVLNPWLGLGGPAFSSLVQGAIRVNTYAGLGAATALYGPAAAAPLALALGVIVPTVNVLCVIVLVLAAGKGLSARAVLMGLATNPLFLAVLAGALLAVLEVRMIPILSPLMDILGRAALPLGLLCVGAALDLGALRAAGPAVAASALLKLVLFPLTALVVGGLAGAEPQVLHVVVLFAAVPTATNGYILARRMGGDAPLMAGMITAQTLLAVVTMPLAPLVAAALFP